MSGAPINSKARKRIGLAICMVVIGFLAAAKGMEVWGRDWPLLAVGSQVYFGVSAAAGVFLLACGAALLIARPPAATVTLLGAIACLALLLNQAVGLWLNTMLCFGVG